MEEKKSIIVHIEGGVSHSLVANKRFLFHSNLSVTDIWRSKMEGGRMIDDFEN
jgi:hypothetical protein